MAKAWRGGVWRRRRPAQRRINNISIFWYVSRLWFSLTGGNGWLIAWRLVA